MTARTIVDKGSRMVTLDQYTVARVEFPSAPNKAAGWVAALQKDAAGRSRTLALDRLEAMMGAVAAEKKAKGEHGGAVRVGDDVYAGHDGNVYRRRATYNFTARSFFRAIVQYVSTTRDPSLYLEPVDRRTADFGASFLFAYKLNWQTVLFAGYGDDRELTETEDWARADRQFFVKVSYAFQR